MTPVPMIAVGFKITVGWIRLTNLPDLFRMIFMYFSLKATLPKAQQKTSDSTGV